MIKKIMASIEKLMKDLKQGENERIEFKKGFTKELLRDIVAFANTKGGTIYVGIDNKGTIIGVEESIKDKIWQALQSIIPPVNAKISSLYVGEKLVVVIEVEKSRALHSIGGVVYIRVGPNNRPLNPQELFEKASESLLLKWDEMPSEYHEKEINKEAWRLFKKKAKENREISLPPLSTFLEGKSLLTQNKKLKNAAALMFVDQLSSSKYGITFLWKEKGEVIKEKRISKNLVESIEEAFSIIKTSIKKVPIKEKGIGKVMIYEYPLWGLREALVNAIAHRNYVDESPVYVIFTSSYVKITNPGSFPPGVSIEKPRHKPRNSLICELLYLAGYIEKFGQGIEKIKKEVANHPLVSVNWVTNSTTEIIFEKAKQLFSDEQMVLKLLEEPLSSSQIAKNLGFSKKKTLSLLSRLIALGLVEKVGSGRATKYKKL